MRWGPRYRALVLLATFASLRWGELAALRRTDIDLGSRTVRVDRQLTELQDGQQVFSSPKSQAGRRLITIPEAIVPDVRQHLERFAQRGDEGLAFVGPQGKALRRSNFRRVWTKALKGVGLSDVHFHDLRHTGNTLAATSGASLRELMERMGHASPRAALIYQHATRDRDQAIANALSALASQGEPTQGEVSEDGDNTEFGT